VDEQRFQPAAPTDPGQRVEPIDGMDLALGGAVSGTLLGLLLLGYFWQALRFGASGAAVAGFSRISRAQVEDQPTREKVANAIRADPGVTAMEMHQGLALTYTTIVYHLRVLEREGIINSVTDGRYRRFFAAADVDVGKRGAMSALRNQRTRGLFDLITDRPGIPHRQLAKHAGISRPAVYWHMERLQAAGLVGRDRVGHAICYYPLETPSVSDVA
jgi:predicted transcriptional regulator